MDPAPPVEFPRRTGRVADAVPALLAALTFGASTPASKVVFAGVPPLLASGWLYLSSGVALALLRLSPRARRRAAAAGGSLRRADWPWLALAIAAGGVAAPYAYVRGIAAASGQVASLLLNLEVVFTSAIAVLAFGERLAAGRWTGIACVVAGGVACSLAPEPAKGGGGWEGGAWIALACAGWALDSNLMRRLVGRDPVAVARWKGLVGGGASLGLALALGDRSGGASPRVLLAGAAIGAVAYGLSLVLYLASLRRLETARTAALFGTAPFVGVVLSWAALDERPDAWVLAAGAAMALGVLLLVRPAPRAVGPARPFDPARPA